MRYSSTIRFVDRYVGSIICFFLTGIHKLRPRPNNRTVRKVLVIELVEMGASTMAYSSLRHIQKTLPDAELFCLCTETTKESWLLLDVIPKENIFALDNRNISTLLASIWRTTRALSKKNIDVILDYELFTRVSAIISFLIKAKFRAGFYGYTMGGLYRGNFLDVKCNFNQNTHIAKNLLALTKSALASSPRYYNWNAPIPNEEIVAPVYRSDAAVGKRVREKIRALYKSYTDEPLITVAPTVGDMLPMRDYPKEQYVEVIRKLLVKYPKHLVVLVGVSGHSSVTEYIEKEVSDPRCIDFCGETETLQELMELFTLSELLISNDSGNPHFAAMAGLKTLALYGPETPFMYGPLGNAVCLYEFFHTSPSITSYNHKNPPSDDVESLRSISPDRVVDTARLLLEGKAAYRTINNEIPYLL